MPLALLFLQQMLCMTIIDSELNTAHSKVHTHALIFIYLTIAWILQTRKFKEQAD